MNPADSDNTYTDLTTQVVAAPGRADLPVSNRIDSDSSEGSNKHLSWASRSDVGLVRGHNEDAFLVSPPLFAVCDGMGGHAAGEVASAIAVNSIAEHAPRYANDVLLGAAVEEANHAIIQSVETGSGKEGMGCTASAVIIEKNHLAVAHVGDSRVYILSGGSLVRVTRDHSFVEELVDLGQITPLEAREHPARSVITRALGSDPDMYADHFMLEVNTGDRIIICSDGLSSMVPDSEIESIAVSCAGPRQAVDTLVSSALSHGGADNVSVIVVDVKNDGILEELRVQLFRRIGFWVAIAVLIIGLFVGGMYALIRSEWYLGSDGEYVTVYQGVEGEIFGLPLSSAVYTSNVALEDLPEVVQKQIEEGISVSDYQSALDTIRIYRQQIQDQTLQDQTTAEEVLSNTEKGEL